MTIRDSQSSAPPTFGNQGLAAYSGPATVSPGPPFHVASTSINLDVESSAPYYVSRHDIPNRHRKRTGLPPLNPTGHATVIEAVSPPSDMDVSPSGTGDRVSPATLNSQCASSSNTSFTPSHDDNQLQHLRRKTCPLNTTDPTISAADTSFSPTTDDDLANFNPAQLFPPPVGLGMHPWEFSAAGQMPTGLTPVSDAPIAWGQILESMSGWEGVGQEQEHEHGF